MEFGACIVGNEGEDTVLSPESSWGISPLANGSHIILQKHIVFMVVIRLTSVWILPEISRGESREVSLKLSELWIVFSLGIY